MRSTVVGYLAATFASILMASIGYYLYTARTFERRIEAEFAAGICATDSSGRPTKLVLIGIDSGPVTFGWGLLWSGFPILPAREYAIRFRVDDGRPMPAVQHGIPRPESVVLRVKPGVVYQQTWYQCTAWSSWSWSQVASEVQKVFR